ncbi:MAG: amidase [Chloroflexi bacterium]|nr:amidase [Chloroflexota bacterium]
MAEPFELSLTEAAAEIAARRLSSVELTESLLARIEALEPRLQAWATLLPERALAEARAADAAEAPRGSLAGVPYGAKDIFDTANIRTAAGSKIWAERVPDTDAASIVLARNAGSVLLGKLHTTEFADGDPAPCFNPWNAEHTPGGSSTGSGVAVAARMVPWAFGSQTVGSVLRPASYNGVVGFKPTFGRIPRLGVIPMATSFDHVGVLVRRVEDVALLLSVLAVHDRDDPFSADVPPDDYVAAVQGDLPAPRLGLVRGWFVNEADAETRLVMEETAQELANAGAVIEEVDPGIDFGRAYAAHRVMQESEMAVWHTPLYVGNESLYGPKITVYVENGFSHTARDYVAASDYRREVQRLAAGAMEQVDALIMPTASAPAPRDRTQTGDTRFQSPWSFTGFPSISVPIGLASDGLPLGAQLAGGPFQEAQLLRAAAWVEQALGVELTPPL